MLLKTADRWKTVKLSSIFIENKTKNSNFSISRAFQFYFGTIVPKKEYELTNDLIETYKKYTIIKKGDIVINGLNLNYDFVTQRVGFVEEEGIMTSAYIAIRPRIELNNKYYCYFFKTLDAHKMFHGMGSGIRLTLSYDDLKSYPLPVPPLSEQNQIVKFLDWKISKINKLISLREQQISELGELKKAIINKAVTKGDWKRVRLKNVAILNPSCSYHGLKPEDEVTFAPMECIRTDERIEKIATLKNNNSSYSSFNEGDIALAKVTPCFQNRNVCLMTNLTNGYAFGSSELFNIRVKNIYSRFLIYYFMTSNFINGGIASMTGVAGLKRVSSEYVRNSLVSLPSIVEQHVITDYLDKKCAQIDTLITNYEKQISEFNELKARLISDTVTGKIDVREIKIPNETGEEND